MNSWKDILFFILFVPILSIVGIVLTRSEGRENHRILNKICCFIGFHMIQKRYFCKYCKKSRNHPKLKAIDGGIKTIYTVDRRKK
jgi:hypothetical protein